MAKLPQLRYYVSLTDPEIDHIDVFSTHPNPQEASVTEGIDNVYISILELISDLHECTYHRAREIWNYMLDPLGGSITEKMPIKFRCRVSVFPREGSATTKAGNTNRFKGRAYYRDAISYRYLSTFMSYSCTIYRHLLAGKSSRYILTPEPETPEPILQKWLPAIRNAQRNTAAVAETTATTDPAAMAAGDDEAHLTPTVACDVLQRLEKIEMFLQSRYL